MAEDRSEQYLKLYKKDGTFVNVGAKGSKKAEIDGLTGGELVHSGEYQVAFSLDNANKPSDGDSAKVDVPIFTPADVPDAPTIALVAGDAKLDFTITKPTEHGSAVTGYTITYTPAGGKAVTQKTTDLTGSIASLTNGTEYSVSVVAESEIGDSPASKTVKATPVAANVAVTKVTLTPATVSVAVGKTTALTGAVEPSNATDKVITYASSNDKIATVDDKGVVTGVAAGTADITGTAHDGSKAAGKSTVTVTA